MNIKKLFFLKGNKGFILIEMLVAVSLILLVLPAALSVSIKAITISSYQKDAMIATYLAEEGQELVRGIRDGNNLAILAGGSGNWNDGFSGLLCASAPAPTPTPCKIDTGGLSAGSGNLDDLALVPNTVYLLYVDANGFYSHSITIGSTPTKFYRGVYITPVPAIASDDQVLVRSIVVWLTPFGRREVTSSGFLTHWLQ